MIQKDLFDRCTYLEEKVLYFDGWYFSFPYILPYVGNKIEEVGGKEGSKKIEMPPKNPVYPSFSEAPMIKFNEN